MNTLIIQTIPIEIIHIILEYSGYHKWRNGKFIKQLEQEKYSAIKEIPQKSRIHNSPFYELIFYKTYKNVQYKNVFRKISLNGHEVLYYNTYKLERKKGEQGVKWIKDWVLYHQICYKYK